MKGRCPICDEWKKLKWLGYVHLDICKSCHSDIDMNLVNKKLPFIIKEGIKSQERYIDNYVFDIGRVLEELIDDEKITPSEYLSCANFLVKEKIIYQCYLSFQQFAFESEMLELSKLEIIKKLESYLPSVAQAVP